MKRKQASKATRDYKPVFKGSGDGKRKRAVLQPSDPSEASFAAGSTDESSAHRRPARLSKSASLGFAYHPPSPSASASESDSEEEQEDEDDDEDGPMAGPRGSGTEAMQAAQQAGFANFKLSAVNGNGSSHKGKGRAVEGIAESRRELPIWSGREAIVRAVQENDTVVLLGETGSGKTTRECNQYYALGKAH